MHILVDGTCLSGNLTGVGKATYHLVRHLVSNPDHQVHLFFDLQTRQSRAIMASLGLTQASLFVGKRHYGFFTSKLVDRWLARWPLRRIDVVHFPNYESHPCVFKGRNVVSVYDLSAEVYPHFFTEPMRHFVQSKGRSAALQAERLVVCSESTRRDLERYWHIPRDRIDVVYLAPALDVTGRAEVELPHPYILFVGTLEPRKNVERTIESFNMLKRDGFPHKLVLVGQKGWLSDSIFSSIENSPYASDIVWKQYLPDAQLVYAYERADLLLYPSHYEGFGLPVLEAMALGTPVITSNVSSLPEVAGDAAVYVDPQDAPGIFESVRGVLRDPAAQEAMRDKGRRQAARFSWENTTRQTLEVYARAAVAARPVPAVTGQAAVPIE